jgi:hypothetical protein
VRLISICRIDKERRPMNAIASKVVIRSCCKFAISGRLLLLRARASLDSGTCMHDTILSSLHAVGSPGIQAVAPIYTNFQGLLWSTSLTSGYTQPETAEYFKAIAKACAMPLLTTIIGDLEDHKAIVWS